MKRQLGSGLVLALLMAGWAGAQTVTLDSLLDEMTDRSVLARLPQPAYTCRQASSYDRDAKAPGEPGWFANWDRSQFVRIEKTGDRTEYVLMDEAGPGAVVRFWATWHGPRNEDGKLQPFTNGILRVYLDGNSKAAIEGPIAEILDGGGLVEPPLAQGVSPETPYANRGHNLYLPIPYSAHCKITYETAAMVDRGAKAGEALYYQINYRTYAKGTAVRSFSVDQLEKVKTKLGRTQQRLLSSGVAAELNSVSPSSRLEPGQDLLTTIRGPAAIRSLSVKLEAENLAQALRSTVLEIKFDGTRTVWCPVGEFMGIGYELAPHRTFYTDVSEDGTMTCYWVMPFEKSLDLALHNLGEQTVTAHCEILRDPWKWDERSLYFHASWRQLTQVDTQGDKDMTGKGAFDVNYVTVQGQGVYVGDTLTIFNGANAWWGEGDEKIFVDGEAFPSHFGTGTEDYYGYAWCKPAFFNAPFHAQPCGRGNLKMGFTANSRYRALDAIPFDESIQMDMELWHWRGTKVNYAPSAFWYARPGARWNVEPDPASAVLPVSIAQVFRVPGAIEGEKLRIVEKTGGITEIQDTGQFGWSDDQQLWWRDGKVGDRLVLEFHVKKTGMYRVVANLTKAVDYGIVKVGVDGEPPKEFDRFHDAVKHDSLELGTFKLVKGPHRLVVELVGVNEKAVPRYMFGLDYLQLHPAP
jgi:hypothetical protein